MMNMHVRHGVKAHFIPHIEYMYLPSKVRRNLGVPMYSVRRFFFFYPPLPKEKSQSQSSIHTILYTYLPPTYLPYPTLPFVLGFAFERERVRYVYIYIYIYIHIYDRCPNGV